MRARRTATAGPADPPAARREDRRFQWLVVVLVALIPVLVVLSATVRYTASDPQGSLLVAEQVLDNGTIALDAYGPELIDGNWRLFESGGRHYYFFPLGSSVTSVPAVAVAKALGVDIAEREPMLQVVLAAVLAFAIMLLLYALARFFLPFRTALALSLAFWLGSMLASSSGSALWSHTFAVLYALIALVSLVAATERACSWCWLPLGASLFMAYLSRPTMAILVVLALAYAFARSRRTALLAGAVAAGLLAVFVLFSEATFGQLLPPYYLPARLGGSDLMTGLVGNLVSPSRGLLVFMPFLVLLPVMAALAPQQVRQRWGLLVVALAWPIAHLLVVARFPDWYGGFSYGPRLLTDALPGLFLAVVVLWPPSFATAYAKAFLAAFVLLAGAAVYIHAYNGLSNPYAWTWNAAPDVNDRPEIIWDWRYPQFLHDEQRHLDRLADYGLGQPAMPLKSS